MGRGRAEPLTRGNQLRPMRRGVLNGHIRLVRPVGLVESKQDRRVRRGYIGQRLWVVSQLGGIPNHRYELGMGVVPVGRQW